MQMETANEIGGSPAQPQIMRLRHFLERNAPILSEAYGKTMHSITNHLHLRCREQTLTLDFQPLSRNPCDARLKQLCKFQLTQLGERKGSECLCEQVDPSMKLCDIKQIWAFRIIFAPRISRNSANKRNTSVVEYNNC